MFCSSFKNVNIKKKANYVYYYMSTIPQNISEDTWYKIDNHKFKGLVWLTTDWSVTHQWSMTDDKQSRVQGTGLINHWLICNWSMINDRWQLQLQGLVHVTWVNKIISSFEVTKDHIASISQYNTFCKAWYILWPYSSTLSW